MLVSQERMLRQGDKLLRKLNPGTWNSTTSAVFPEAFEDQHENLSLFVARIKTPSDVLRHFEKFGSLRAHYFGNREHRTADEMWRIGFGVGVLSYEDITALGLTFKPYEDGFEIEEGGHVDVVSGQEFMLELSEKARALSKADVFPI
jgi:hypothetical protein